MSCEKCVKGELRKHSLTGLFVTGIILGIVLFGICLLALVSSKPGIALTNAILVSLIPCALFWTVMYAYVSANYAPRYLYRWIDLVTGEEHRHIGMTFAEVYESPCCSNKKIRTPIVIRQKLWGIGGSSALIIPGSDFPNVAGWSLDQSSTIHSIMLVDRSGMKTTVASLESAIWLISNRNSVIDAVESGRGDEARAEQFGTERDQLIGAFLCLERLVDQQRDTFGNSPYGTLVRHYTNVVLRNLLEQDVDLTRSVFVEKMNGWQHLADQCITRFGRR